MKRIIIKLVIFLVLGAVVNVGVAWGCAAWVKLDRRQAGKNGYDLFTAWGLPTESDEAKRFWGYSATRYERFGSQRVFVSHSSGYHGMRPKNTISFEEIIPRWARSFLDIPELSDRRPAGIDEAHTHSAIVEGRGWPCFALWGGVKRPHPGVTVYTDGHPIPLVERNYCVIWLDRPGVRASFTYRWLPLCPIFPGFLINALFYAVILWAVWSAPFATRRVIRKRRGRCVRCGYDLRHAEHEVCPECGS